MQTGAIQQLGRAGAILALLALCACTTTEPLPEPPRTPEPLVVNEPEPDPLPVIAEPVDETPRLVQPAREPVDVAIVLSSRQPGYELVANELESRLERYTVFDLGDKSQPPVTVFRRIADSGADAVVAIGHRAAVSAVSMAEVPVIFCQVFNYQDSTLLNNNSRGVAVLPPLELQLAAWKKIDPGLRRVGAIIGAGHEVLIEEAEAAAAAHGIELQLRTVKSDRETQYVFNRLAAEIDGFWLFPDNRVLSATVLQHMLGLAARRGVQVAVFNEALLPMGASISSTATESDIAATIASIVLEIEGGHFNEVPPLSSLSDIRVVTNDEVMRQMQLARQEKTSEATAQVSN